MKGKKNTRDSASRQRQASSTANTPRRALPPPSRGAQRSNRGQPGGGQGRVDIVGIVPRGIRVDPNITEGHPGYQESGDSEIRIPKRTGKGRKT